MIRDDAFEVHEDEREDRSEFYHYHTETCKWCNGTGEERLEGRFFRCPDCGGSGIVAICDECGQYFDGEFCEDCFEKCPDCGLIIPVDSPCPDCSPDAELADKIAADGE